MKVGLYDVDGHNFPNLALMKISAWHKQRGDSVEWIMHLLEYDRVYVSKVFGSEYSCYDETVINAKEIIYGGTGFAIKVNDGVENYYPELDGKLPEEIEHIYPDYSLYPELTKDTAFGFLSRGCPNKCDFCSVWKKEGCKSIKVANLSEFWRGQRHIKLMDGNLLACRDRIDLLKQLIKSNAKIDFTQGLDARCVTREVAELLGQIDCDGVHFAWDSIKNEAAIVRGLNNYKSVINLPKNDSGKTVYILTNFDTTHAQDIYRVNKIVELGFAPYVMIYRKNSAPPITRHLQRWCNNRRIFHSTPFEEYRPHANKKTIGELYYANNKM